jgi:hypothetical protein
MEKRIKPGPAKAPRKARKKLLEATGLSFLGRRERNRRRFDAILQFRQSKRVVHFRFPPQSSSRLPRDLGDRPSEVLLANDREHKIDKCSRRKQPIE